VVQASVKPRAWIVGAMMAVCTGQPAAAGPTDAEQLLALHAAVMQAHRDGDVEALLADESADYVVASRGEISRPTLAERRGFLGPYLAQTKFEEYRDLVEPVVRVSADGAAGWVVVSVYARGARTHPDGERRPIEFTSAWIELYEKRDGRWLRTGNVSNFRD
jgi:hypothetical protein